MQEICQHTYNCRAELDKLEALLHYANATCASAVADMDPIVRITWQANVTCVAAEAFITRKTKDVTTDVLVKAVAPYFEELRKHLGKGEQTLPAPGNATLEWIKFDAVAGGDGVVGGEAIDNVRLLPMVIKHDERVGAPVSEQKTRAEEHAARNTAVAVPWKEWLRSHAAQELDQQSAAIAAVTLVLIT